MMARFVCRHELARFLEAMLVQKHDLRGEPVKVHFFYPSQLEEVVCEVEASSRQAFRRWLKAINAPSNSGDIEEGVKSSKQPRKGLKQRAHRKGLDAEPKNLIKENAP